MTGSTHLKIQTTSDHPAGWNIGLKARETIIPDRDAADWGKGAGTSFHMQHFNQLDYVIDAAIGGPR